jgi:hypothetical protein
MDTKNKTNRKYQLSFYESAPMMLIEKIAELNAALSKHRGNGNNGSAISFYEGVLNVMRLASMYMRQTKWIHDRNNILESNIRFLAQHNKELQERLDEYETVARLKLEGRLDEVMDIVGRVVEDGAEDDNVPSVAE